MPEAEGWGVSGVVAAGVVVVEVGGSGVVVAGGGSVVVGGGEAVLVVSGTVAAVSAVAVVSDVVSPSLLLQAVAASDIAVKTAKNRLTYLGNFIRLSLSFHLSFD